MDRTDAEIEGMFKQVDTDGSGNISRAEMESALTKLNGGRPVEPCQVDAMMLAADTDGDDEINLAEFKAVVRAPPPVPLMARWRPPVPSIATVPEGIRTVLVSEAVSPVAAAPSDAAGGGASSSCVSFETEEAAAARNMQRHWRGHTARKSSQIVSVYLEGDVTRQPTVLPEPRGGRNYHIFVSPYNNGAEELLEELRRERQLPRLQWTSKLEEASECEQMLVYLNSDTWSSENRDAFAQQLRTALDRKMLILLTHETPGFEKEARRGNTFEQLTASTPQEIVNRRIYGRISVPLKGGMYRLLSLTLLAEQICAVKIKKAPGRAGLRGSVTWALPSSGTEIEGENEHAIQLQRDDRRFETFAGEGFSPFMTDSNITQPSGAREHLGWGSFSGALSQMHI